MTGDRLTVTRELQQGTESIITYTNADGDPAPGVTVTIVHRPGLQGSSESAAGITDGLGRVRFVPTEGGVVEIRAQDEMLRSRVAYSPNPVEPSLLLALLAFAASGSLTLGMRRTGRKLRRVP